MITNVCSFSGGKDSSAMVLTLLENNEPIHSLVFVDTGFEFPALYSHIEKFEKYVGIPIIRLNFSTSFESLMTKHVISRGKHKGQAGYGWPRPNARYCTTYKTNAFDKYKRNELKGIAYNECIGIAYDEQNRAKKNKRYPLIEYQMTEKDCLHKCYENGFYYDGLYEKFDRLSCYLCPLKKLKEYEIIYKEFPELWEKMRLLDNSCINEFRIDYSLKQLEDRFNA